MAAVIVLQSSDDRLFKVDVNVAKMSTTIKDMLESLGDPEERKEEIIPVQVEGDILEKVLEWAEYHHNLNENDNGSSSKGNGVNHDDDDNWDRESDNGIDKNENGNEGNDNEMSEWNQQFFKIENEILYAVTRAANFLDIKELLDNCCDAVSNLIWGKTPRQIRELFGLPWPTVEKKQNGKAQKAGELQNRG